MKISNIGIFGFADATLDSPLYKDAYQVSKLLAENGYTIVNGGGPGVMKAASLGAKDGGGETIGVTFYPKDVSNFEGRDKGNVLDHEIVTKNYLERTLKLLEIGDVFVIFKGGTGTISEFGMAWGLAKLYFGHHKPLILYGESWYPIIEAIAKNMPLRPEELRVYSIVTTAEAVLNEVKRVEENVGSGDHTQNEGSFSL